MEGNCWSWLLPSREIEPNEAAHMVTMMMVCFRFLVELAVGLRSLEACFSGSASKNGLLVFVLILLKSRLTVMMLGNDSANRPVGLWLLGFPSFWSIRSKSWFSSIWLMASRLFPDWVDVAPPMMWMSIEMGSLSHSSPGGAVPSARRDSSGTRLSLRAAPRSRIAGRAPQTAGTRYSARKGAPPSTTAASKG